MRKSLLFFLLGALPCSAHASAAAEVPAEKHAFNLSNPTQTVAEETLTPTIIASGDCGLSGDNVKWVVTADSTLTLSGTGMTQEYDDRSPEVRAPFYAYNDRIKHVVVEEGVTGLMAYVFDDMDFETLQLPSTLSELGLLALANLHNLEELVLPDALKKIHNYSVAHNPAMKKVVFGKNFERMDARNFNGMYALNEIVSNNPVPPVLEGSSVFKGMDYKKVKLSIPEGSEEAYKADPLWRHILLNEQACGDSLFYEVADGEITITGKGAMYDDAVYAPRTEEERNAITTLVLNEGMTSIGSFAFGNLYNLREVVIPEGVTTIGQYAFIYDGNLSKVVIPSTVTSIGKSAFDGCNSIKNIEVKATTPPACEGRIFSWDIFSEADVLVPDASVELYKAANGWDGFRNIHGEYLYSGMYENLTWKFNIHNELIIEGEGDMVNQDFYTKYPWNDQLYYETVKTLIVKEGVTSIGSSSFNLKTLEQVFLPKSIKAINRGAFAGSGIKEIVIPDSVTELTPYLFNFSSQLHKVVIGSNVTTIGENTFGNLASLDTLVMECATPPAADPASFFGTDYINMKFIIPEGAKEAYLASPFWEPFITKVIKCGKELNWEVEDGVLTITGNGEMYDWASADATPWASQREDIVKVILPEGMQTIPAYTFSGMTELKEIVLPETIESIGENAFYKCRSLSNINMPEALTKIDNDAFEKSGLLHVVLPSTLKELGERAFASCEKLDSIIIDGEFTQIPANLCYSNDSLKSVKILNDVEKISSRAFYMCENLKDIQLPTTLKTIGSKVFYYTQLREVILPESVTEIDYEVFSGCDSLRMVVLSDSLKYMDNDIFSYSGSLKTLQVNAIVPPVVTKYTFKNIDTAMVVIVPAASFDTYKSTEGWNIFYNMVSGYRLSLEVEGEGVIVGNERKYYRQGEKTTIEAVPAEDYLFTQWSDGCKDRVREVTVDGDMTLTAEFASVTGVENAMKDQVEISAKNGVLSVKGFDGMLRIYNVEGRLIYSGNNEKVMLKSGLYIVVMNDHCVKVKM